MLKNTKRTKIVCTLGPASEKEEVLTALIENGLNVTRMNFSHGSHEEHKGRMDLVKKVREKLNKPVALLLDTKGPEIRTGNFDQPEVLLEEGQKFTITMKDVIGTKEICTVSYKGLANDVVAGDTILIDDGLVGLRVEEVNGDDILCIVENSGIVKNHKGVNVPGVKINLPALTDKDISDIEFGISQGIDFIAASFVRKVSDVLAIREVLERNNATDIQIISKIENQEGVDNLDDIIAVSDGIYKYLIYDLKQKPTKIIKVPNPINVKEINVKSKKKCEFNLPDNYIVFIGRLGAVKNIYMLLDAYEKARLNECYLVIVGDGVDMMSLQKYAIKLSKKKRIIFTGATNNPLPVLRNAKSLVLPSFSEAFPTVLLEAICLGVPVVATPTEGAKEILNNLPNAYISNSFTDSDEFAKLLEQAYCQPKIDLSSYLKIYDEKVICASLINSCI